MARNATVGDVLDLAKIIEAARHGSKVTWATDVSPEGKLSGIARAITRGESAGYLPAGADVRDGHLRVTLAQGWESWLPVPEVLEMFRMGLFVIQ